MSSAFHTKDAGSDCYISSKPPPMYLEVSSLPPFPTVLLLNGMTWQSRSTLLVFPKPHFPAILLSIACPLRKAADRFQYYTLPFMGHHFETSTQQ